VKKTYVKPELDVIEFDLGEAIAASQCVAQAYNHDRTSCTLLPPFDTLCPPGQDANLFGTGEDQCSVTVEGYCYFTVNTVNTMVFAS
jgi:hypothetical protein